jgi:hypothetical protein
MSPIFGAFCKAKANNKLVSDIYYIELQHTRN